MTAWQPLRHAAFRALWIASLSALTATWIVDSTAAWLMTTLSASPLHVALASAAVTLPILLMALPAGAVADLLDRRTVLVMTQVWVAVVAVVMCLVTLTGKLTAELLLALIFAHGIGAAIRFPVVTAMTPDLVPRNELPGALALHAVTYNGARVLGPLIAGVLLAWLGGEWVFLACAVLAAGIAAIFARGASHRRESSLPSERFVAAMRLGLQFARQSPTMVAALAHISLYTFFGVIAQALLPLVARDRLGGNANTYTLLLAAIGAGAIAAVLILPSLRGRLNRDQLLTGVAILQAVATAVLSQATSLWVAAPAVFIGGAMWVCAFNTLSVISQMALPDWVRARGSAVFLASGMVGATAGAFAWGQVSSWLSIERAMEIAATAGLAAFFLLLRRYRMSGLAPLNLTPAGVTPVFAAGAKVDEDEGPVMCTIEYQIDPVRAEEFIAVMHDSRRWRLRMGAIHWGLYRDVSDHGRYVEHFLVESWVDRLRQIERLTAEDIALRDRKNQFHLGSEPPVMRHLLMEPV